MRLHTDVEHYRLILNYNFVSFLVFYSLFNVSFYVFSFQVTKSMKCTKGAEKASKWMHTDESRQEVLATTNFNLAAMKTTLATKNANFIATKNHRIKWKLEKPEPTRCNENMWS